MQLNTNNTTVRQSPRTDFGAQMRNGVAGGAQVAAGAAGVAAPFVPGGAVVSAAFSNAAKSMGGGGGSMGAASGGGGVSAGDIPFNGPGMESAGGGGKKSGNMQQDLMNQTQDMQEMMASFNLQYLQLQNKMQAENRSYTTISNVMKTKHDTAKSSIQNVR
ncbi:MAG: hypothetical protein GY822_20500 [Deltaproteobacteria bacterium]|nr:hypothetical protein [Deltaproteobacteria bacterium]